MESKTSSLKISSSFGHLAAVSWNNAAEIAAGVRGHVKVASPVCLIIPENGQLHCVPQTGTNLRVDLMLSAQTDTDTVRFKLHNSHSADVASPVPICYLTIVTA